MSSREERIAQITAHRACGSAEHDVAKGKIHGYCVVCLKPWPCAYVGPPPPVRPPIGNAALKAELAAVKKNLNQMLDEISADKTLGPGDDWVTSIPEALRSALTDEDRRHLRKISEWSASYGWEVSAQCLLEIANRGEVKP